MPNDYGNSQARSSVQPRRESDAAGTEHISYGSRREPRPAGPINGQIWDEQKAPKPASNVRLPQGVTAAELQDMEFPPLGWIVNGYVAAGLTVLAGKPKIGKSWLALDIALAVPDGGIALGGRGCAKGLVLYAALEDTRRRLQNRLRKIQGANERRRWAEGLTLWSYGQMNRLDAGGLDQLRAWIAMNPGAALIIIDTFAKVRSGARGKESAYDADYREIGELKALADETGVAIIVVLHLRKQASEDPYDTVSGTLGITGAADTTVILSRDGKGAILRANGRDVEEIETAVEFQRDLCRWKELGDAAVVRRSAERAEILAILFEANESLNAAEISAETGRNNGATRRLLSKMAKSKEVLKDGRGRYAHPDIDPGNNGNSGNNGERAS